MRRVLEHTPVPLHAVAEVLGGEGYLQFNRELTAGEVAALLATMEQRAGGEGSMTSQSAPGELRVADARATVMVLQQSCKAACESAQQQEPIPGKIALVRAKLSAASVLAAMHLPSAVAALQEAASALEEIRELQAAPPPPAREAALRATHRISRFAAESGLAAQLPLPEQQQQVSAGPSGVTDVGGAHTSLRTWFPPLSPATPAAHAAIVASQAASMGHSGSGEASSCAGDSAEPACAGRVSKWSPLPAQQQWCLPSRAAGTSLAQLLDDVLEEVLTVGPPISAKQQANRRKRLRAKRAKKRRRLTPTPPAPSHPLQALRQGTSSPASTPDARPEDDQPAEAPAVQQGAVSAAADRRASAGDAPSDMELTPLANGSAEQGGGGSSRRGRGAREPEVAPSPPAAGQHWLPSSACSPGGVSIEDGEILEGGLSSGQRSPSTPANPLPAALALILNGQVWRPAALHHGRECLQCVRFCTDPEVAVQDVHSNVRVTVFGWEACRAALRSVPSRSPVLDF